MKTVKKGSIGVSFRIQFLKANGSPFDLSTADTVQIRLMPPSGTRMDKTGTLVSDGEDGWAKWVTSAATDIDEEGRWEIAGYATKAGAGAYTHYTEEGAFLVEDPL